MNRPGTLSIGSGMGAECAYVYLGGVPHFSDGRRAARCGLPADGAPLNRQGAQWRHDPEPCWTTASGVRFESCRVEVPKTWTQRG